MLSKPQFGWTDITIGDWTGKLSYIDDVPIILLNAFYNVFSNQNPKLYVSMPRVRIIGLCLIC